MALIRRVKPGDTLEIDGRATIRFSGSVRVSVESQSGSRVRFNDEMPEDPDDQMPVDECEVHFPNGRIYRLKVDKPES